MGAADKSRGESLGELDLNIWVSAIVDLVVSLLPILGKKDLNSSYRPGPISLVVEVWSIKRGLPPFSQSKYLLI